MSANAGLALQIGRFLKHFVDSLNDLCAGRVGALGFDQISQFCSNVRVDSIRA